MNSVSPMPAPDSATEVIARRATAASRRGFGFSLVSRAGAAAGLTAGLEAALEAALDAEPAAALGAKGFAPGLAGKEAAPVDLADLRTGPRFGASAFWDAVEARDGRRDEKDLGMVKETRAFVARTGASR